MIIEGLANTNLEEAKRLAENIAINWIKTNAAVYKKTGSMHEKCDVKSCGEFGGGGEYQPQVSSIFLFSLCLSCSYRGLDWLG
jgi:alpha,alpha-trehalase